MTDDVRAPSHVCIDAVSDLAVLWQAGVLVVVELPTLRPLLPAVEFDVVVHKAVMARGDLLMLLVTDEQELLLLNLGDDEDEDDEDGLGLFDLTPPGGAVDVAFVDNGVEMLALGPGGQLWFRTLNDGSAWRQMEQFDFAPTSMHVSLSGDVVVVADNARALTIPLDESVGFTDDRGCALPLLATALSVDGERLAAITPDARVVCWTLLDNVVSKGVSVDVTDTGDVGLAWVPGTSCVVVDGQAVVDVVTGDTKALPTPSGVVAWAVSADAECLVALTADDAVHVVDLYGDEETTSVALRDLEFVDDAP